MKFNKEKYKVHNLKNLDKNKFEMRSIYVFNAINEIHIF